MIPYFWLLALSLSLALNEYNASPNVLSQEMVDYINGLNTTWKAEMTTRFQNASDVKRMLGVIQDPTQFRLPKLRSYEGISNEELPVQFDSRVKWSHCPSISEIRDQSACGSCWAFGAVEAMSDRICIASHGKFRLFLSAENLLSCCISCGQGCNGGYPNAAWQYWKKYGIVTGDLYNNTNTCQPYSLPPCEHHVNGTRPPCTGDYPTPSCKHKCQNGYKIPYNKDKWFAKKVYQISSDPDDIRRELMKNGPLEADFEVYSDFPNYKSGVYQRTSNTFLGGHAVRLLGWGVENGTPYWLLANSWNTDWGNNGYFKIIRGIDECGIESGIIGGLPKLKHK